MIEFGFLFSSLIIFSPRIMSSIFVLNYYLKMNNPKYVFSAGGLISSSVSTPRIEQCGSPFSTLKLLHFSFPVCISDMPPPLSKIQKTLSYLALPVLSHLQYPSGHSCCISSLSSLLCHQWPYVSSSSSRLQPEL